MALDVAFLGFEPAGSENLPLRLLARAADNAGYSVRVATASRKLDGARVLRKVLKRNPAALGFNLNHPTAALFDITLATLARKWGYTGYIFCAGSVASLQTEWLLERVPALDGLLRFDAQTEIKALLDSVIKHEPLKYVAGMATRNTRNAPRIHSSNPVWTPVRGTLPTVFGVPIAEVASSKGCNHRCDYCTHAAMAERAFRESGVRDVPRSTLHARYGNLLRRPLNEFADEIAALYHHQGARFFQLSDSHPVPEKKADAVDWAQTLRKMLDVRKVGPVGFGMMTRADRLDRDVVDALQKLGLMRTLAGVESGSESGLNRLGRRGDFRQGIRGLDALSHAGVATVFNSLLLNPQSTPDTVREELNFLDGVRGVIFDAAKLRPYAGTVAYDNLQRAHRLEGGEIYSTFNFDDPVMQRFAALQVKAASRVGRNEPVAIMCDLLLSTAILERFGGRPGSAALVREDLLAFAHQVNRDRVFLLRNLLSAAENDTDGELAIARWMRVCTETTVQLGKLENRLTTEAGNQTSAAHYYRNFSAALALTFALSTGVGCNRVEDISDQTVERNNDPDDDESDSSAAMQSTNPVVGEDTDSGKKTDTGEDTEILENGCTQTETTENNSRLSDTGRECVWQEGYDEPYKILIGSDGFVEKITLNPDAYAATEMEACLYDILSGEQFPCLAGEDLEQYYPIVLTE
ncbi:MAG: radical SAM protein [Deltaproteobacteria bacterium]|nr:radical SAM protein [Deltaproteobacteria bacterium]MBN2673835.1 radical SAM protein [Deltaproteobacteria bacterium]